MRQRLLFCIAILALILISAGFAEGTGETAMDYRMEESDIPDRGKLMDISQGEGEHELRMKIGMTDVTAVWERNESVEALKELCQDRPLTILMSMYGGFEQVGPIGRRLPSQDRQTTTSAGDIVLYSSSQMVVFYGSNSWAYTRLGHIVDKTPEELRELLGQGDVTITISVE